MSNSDSGAGCISEVTLAISKARGSQAGAVTVLDSPDSDGSGESNSFSVRRFNYPDNASANSDTLHSPTLGSEDLRIPIVGYEVMEERARFTVSQNAPPIGHKRLHVLHYIESNQQVYKLRVELKNGTWWFVFRRYTDFARLLSQLRRQKVAVAHLSLPRKKWLGDNFAPSFLEERIRRLQALVNGILSSPVLLGTGCVREFFCLDEPPALPDTAEESRAIFEALEDTIYQLRQQLRERDRALASQSALRKELELKLQRSSNERRNCPNCGSPQE